MRKVNRSNYAILFDNSNNVIISTVDKLEGEIYKMISSEMISPKTKKKSFRRAKQKLSQRGLKKMRKLWPANI